MTMLDIGLSCSLFLAGLVAVIDWRKCREIDWEADPLTEARQFRSE